MWVWFPMVGPMDLRMYIISYHHVICGWGEKEREGGREGGRGRERLHNISALFRLAHKLLGRSQLSESPYYDLPLSK